MLSEIFYWVFNISLTGSAVGLIIVLLRKIKKLPRFACYLLWAIPCVRLWLPFGIANRYSLFSLIAEFTSKTVIVSQDWPYITSTNVIMGAESYFPIVYKNALLAHVFTTASVIWLIIAAAGILTAILLYYFTKSELRKAELIRDNIYKSDKISSPAVYGLFRPRIIIPSALADGDIDYILLHERTHIRRGDNLWRIAAVITACIHWFNPLVWIFMKLFFEDMELACDAKVIKKLNANQTKEYAAAILSCAAGKTFFASAFGGARIKVRIENILSYKKLTLLSLLYFVAFLIVIAIVLVTNAAV